MSKIKEKIEELKKCRTDEDFEKFLYSDTSDRALIELREGLFKKRDEVISKQYRQAVDWIIKKIDELVK